MRISSEGCFLNKTYLRVRLGVKGFFKSPFQPKLFNDYLRIEVLFIENEGWNKSTRDTMWGSIVTTEECTKIRGTEAALHLE